MKWVLAAMVAVVLLGACSQQDERAQDEPTSKRPELLDAPSWRPLSSGDIPTREPTAVSGRPSIDRTEEVAERGSDRTSGEQFALAAVHLILDVRPELSGADVVRAIASPSLDPEVRAYLVDDVDGQQAVGTKRQIDTGLSTWIRSQSFGESTETPQVRVEIVCNVRSDPMRYSSWSGTRVDVTLEDGRWRVVTYSEGGPVVTSGAELTRSERRHLLTGSGWRRIPPAD